MDVDLYWPDKNGDCCEKKDMKDAPDGEKICAPGTIKGPIPGQFVSIPRWGNQIYVDGACAAKPGYVFPNDDEACADPDSHLDPRPHAERLAKIDGIILNSTTNIPQKEGEPPIAYDCKVEGDTCVLMFPTKRVCRPVCTDVKKEKRLIQEKACVYEGPTRKLYCSDVEMEGAVKVNDAWFDKMCRRKKCGDGTIQAMLGEQCEALGGEKDWLMYDRLLPPVFGGKRVVEPKDDAAKAILKFQCPAGEWCDFRKCKCMGELLAQRPGPAQRIVKCDQQAGKMMGCG